MTFISGCKGEKLGFRVLGWDVAPTCRLLSVDNAVCRFGTQASCAETDEPIDMPFEGRFMWPNRPREIPMGFPFSLGKSHFHGHLYSTLVCNLSNIGLGSPDCRCVTLGISRGAAWIKLRFHLRHKECLVLLLFLRYTCITKESVLTVLIITYVACNNISIFLQLRLVRPTHYASL